MCVCTSINECIDITLHFLWFQQLNSKQEAFKKITFDGCKPGSAFEDMSTNPSDVYGKAAMSVVESLCQREGIKVESQQSLSLITKMSSVLLQIEVSFVD